jgi:hypothetical protein
MQRRLAILALLALVPSSVHALDVSGVHFADQTMLDGTRLELNGAGVRHVTIFGIEVYVAGLYVEARTTDASEILRADRSRELQLVMKRDVGHDQIGAAFREAIEHEAGARAASLRTELDAFVAWIPVMHDRDRLTVSYTPAAGLVITATSSPTPFHGTSALAEAFFGMWIGARPVEDSLHDALLGR